MKFVDLKFNPLVMRPIYFLFIFFVTLRLSAQVPRPQLSPKAKIIQTVGLSEVTIDYSRPSVRQRTVFGDLVPYHELWRTGANQNTLISFSHDVLISGQPLSQGTYALFTVPAKSFWMVYFYHSIDHWGTPKKWDETQVSLAIQAEVQKVSHTESFQISIENITLQTADLQLAWETTAIQIPMVFPTNEIMESHLSKMSIDSASANDLYAGAVYYLNESKNLQQAKEWITRAVELKDDAFWFYRQKSLIHEALGEMNMAIDAAQISLGLAQSVANQQYVKINEKQLRQWTEN